MSHRKPPSAVLIYCIFDATYPWALLPCMKTNVYVFVQVVIMTLYVKGFKLDRRKITWSKKYN